MSNELGEPYKIDEQFVSRDEDKKEEYEARLADSQNITDQPLFYGFEEGRENILSTDLAYGNKIGEFLSDVRYEVRLRKTAVEFIKNGGTDISELIKALSGIMHKKSIDSWDMEKLTERFIKYERMAQDGGDQWYLESPSELFSEEEDSEDNISTNNFDHILQSFREADLQSQEGRTILVNKLVQEAKQIHFKAKNTLQKVRNN